MAVFTAIAAAFTAVGTWFAGLSAIGAFAVRLGVGLALNGIASAIQRKKLKSLQANQKTPGVTFQLQQGADQPRSFIVGQYATAGSLVYHNSWGSVGGTPNAYYTRVTALSDLPVTGLVSVWIDGQRCTLDTANEDPEKGFPVVNYRVNSSGEALTVTDGDVSWESVTGTTDYCWVKFHDGNQTEADDFLVSTVSTPERPWTSTEVGVGVAYAIVTCRFNQELFQGGPRVMYVLDGVPLTDPATGLVGTGDRLPAVQAYHVLKGIFFQGEWFYGLQGVSDARFDLVDWSAQIEKCRVPVPGGSAMTNEEREAAFGSTTVPPTYQSGGEISVDVEIGNALEAILSGCNGRLVDTGWKYRILVGPPGDADVQITDDDILSTEEQTFTPFFGLADITNGVTAIYPEPDEEWQSQAAPPLYVAEYEEADGGRRLVEQAELPMVPYREQVQRLMTAVLAEARRARRHTLALGPRFWALEPGDVISWTSERNGYADKLFRVDGLYDLPTADIVVDLTEVDAADYDWDAGQDFRPVAIGTISPQPTPAQPFAGLQLYAHSVVTAGGKTEPAIAALWTPGLDLIEGVRYQVRAAGETLPFLDTKAPSYDGGGVVIHGPISPSSAYQVRAIYTVQPRRPVEWSDWEDVSTGIAGAPTAPVYRSVEVEPVVATSGVVSKVRWFPYASLGAITYSLHMTDPNGDRELIDTTSGLGFDVPLDPELKGEYTLHLAAIDTSGNVSPETDYPFTYGDETTTIGNVQNFRIRILGDQAHLTWDKGEAIVDHYHIKHLAPNAPGGWNEAVDVELDVPGRVVAVPALPGRYLIKAVSVFDTYSPQATIATSTIVGLSGYNAVETVTFGPDFLGEYGDGLYKTSLGVQLLSDSTWSTWGDWADIGFWSHEGEIAQQGVFTSSEVTDLGAAMTSRVTATVDGYGYDMGLKWSDIGLWGDLGFWAGDVEGTWRIKLQISTTQDDPSASPDWSDWADFLVGDYLARGYRFRVIFESTNGQTSSVLRGLSVQIDVPDRILEGADITCPAEGVAVSFSPPFLAKPAIAVDGQGLPAGARSVRTTATSAGFHQQFLDENGDGVACTFDYIAKGYGQLEQ
ncbi:phage tail protein [uncultured Planktomarina sp.]|uniref:phage tail protein n=1 Tax=uncultured Planktomarina sp. TaxID=1538529 RepID=UPI003261AF27